MISQPEQRAITDWIERFAASRKEHPLVRTILDQWMKTPAGRCRVLDASLGAARLRLDFLRTKLQGPRHDEYVGEWKKLPRSFQRDFVELLEVIPYAERNSESYGKLWAIVEEVRKLCQVERVGLPEHMGVVGSVIDAEKTAL